MDELQRGFSIVELLVIIVIISIIAAFTIPTYQINTTQARLATVIPVLDGLMHEVLITYGQTGAAPVTLNNVSGASGGSYGAFVVSNSTAFLHYVDGQGWVNIGALIQISVPSNVGKAISGYVASTNGSDGAYNSIAMAFYDNKGTVQIYCGRWDSSNTIYIPPTYLPPGCDNDNFAATVMGS